MEMLVLDAQIRDPKVKKSAVRALKMIPAVCYGKGFENRVIQIDYQGFRKAYMSASTTQVITLNVGKDKVPVLIHEIKYDPMTDLFAHVDFLQIDMKKKVDATVPVEVTGVSPAVKNFGAVITIVKHEVEVRCLPMDIPHEILVDVSTLENLGDVFHVSDLKLGSGVEILSDLEETLVSVNAVEEFVEKEAVVPDELKVEPTTAEGAAADKKDDDSKDKKDKD